MPAVRTVRALLTVLLLFAAHPSLALAQPVVPAEGDADEVVVLGSAPSSGFVSKASVDDAPRVLLALAERYQPGE